MGSILQKTAVAALAVGTTCLLLGQIISGQQDTAGRRFMTNGKPIVTQLRPGDARVVIEINAFRGLTIGPNPGESRLGFLGRVSPVVVAVRIQDRRPVLVSRQLLDNTPAPLSEANWIVTNVRARIERVLKADATLPLEEGGELVFEEDGGSAVIAATQVEAVVPWLRPLAVGRRYLLFGRVQDGRFVKETAYEEQAPGLSLKTLNVPVRVRPGTEALSPAEKDEVEWLRLDDAIVELEFELRKRN